MTFADSGPTIFTTTARSGGVLARAAGLFRPARSGCVLGLGAALLLTFVGVTRAVSMPPQTSSAAFRQLGTVKTVTPNKLTIATDAGLKVSVNVVDEAKVLQLAPGSTDLKTAQTIKLADIEVGDRVLVSGHSDAPDAMTASRVILMKSSDIAQKHVAEQEDWQKRGIGGLVSAVDPATGSIIITARAKKIEVATAPTTVYRRYDDGSVKFEDAKLGTIGQIQTGDQLRVRGAKSDDGTSIKAEEIVSGSFKNLAGTIVSVDASASTLAIKDIANKKTYVIKITPNSSVRALPAEAAARFAARAKASQPGTPPASPQTGTSTSGQGRTAPGDGHGEAAGSVGGDLSQLINRLPQGSISDLHPGEALMIVASQEAPGGDTLTAVTLLSGVEPILAATPKGEASMTLSPWSLGSEGGGA